MKSAGIDIGSRSIEIVVTEDGVVIDFQQADTGHDPAGQVKKMLDGVSCERIMATGYGRQLMEIAFDSPTVTEIKAYAAGVHRLFPEARFILDIGGQDSKVIALLENGRIRKFEMNDRCAAGTGKFLEIMAKTLGFSLDEFGEHALQAEREIQINSMCAVFAESEVISLITKGMDRNDIALGLHASVSRRALSMLKRVGCKDSLVFAGGVANNLCMVRLLEQFSGHNVLVPEHPQMIGALGASLLAAVAG